MREGIAHHSALPRCIARRGTPEEVVGVRVSTIRSRQYGSLTLKNGARDYFALVFAEK